MQFTWILKHGTMQVEHKQVEVDPRENKRRKKYCKLLNDLYSSYAEAKILFLFYVLCYSCKNN